MFDLMYLRIISYITIASALDRLPFLSSYSTYGLIFMCNLPMPLSTEVLFLSYILNLLSKSFAILCPFISLYTHQVLIRYFPPKFFCFVSIANFMFHIQHFQKQFHHNSCHHYYLVCCGSSSYHKSRKKIFNYWQRYKILLLMFTTTDNPDH